MNLSHGFQIIMNWSLRLIVCVGMPGCIALDSEKADDSSAFSVSSHTFINESPTNELTGTPVVSADISVSENEQGGAESSSRLHRFSPIEPDALSPSQRQFARSVASYAAGISDQLAGRLPAALARYRHSILLNPDFDMLYLRTAGVYNELGDADSGLAILKKLTQQRPEHVDGYVWLGALAKASGNEPLALASFRHAMRLDPGNPDIYTDLASAYLAEEQMEKAILVMERAAKNMPNSAQVILTLAQLYMLKSEQSTDPESQDIYRKQSLETMVEHSALHRDDVDYLLFLGESYIADGQIDAAVPVYEKLTQIQPDDLEAQKKLALCYAARGEIENAAKSLEAITRRSPFSPQAYYYLGELYEKMGEREKAVLNFRLATKLDPPQADPFLHLAMLSIDDNPEDAIDYLLEGLLVLPDDARLNETLGHLYFSMRMMDHAYRFFSAASRAPSDLEYGAIVSSFRIYYAISAMNVGKYAEAQQLLADEFLSNPDAYNAFVSLMMQEGDADSLEQAVLLLNEPPSGINSLSFRHRAAVAVAEARIYTLLHRFDEALHCYTQTEQMFHAEGDVPVAHPSLFYFMFGALQESMGNQDEALRLMNEALAYDGENADAYNYIAYMWAEKGVNLRKAEKYINKALAIDPENAAFQDTLGWIYFLQGRYSEALLYIEKARQQLPEDEIIADHLFQVQERLKK